MTHIHHHPSIIPQAVVLAELATMTDKYWKARADEYQQQMHKLLKHVVLKAHLINSDNEDLVDELALTLYKWRNYRQERNKCLAIVSKEPPSTPLFPQHVHDVLKSILSL